LLATHVIKGQQGLCNGLIILCALAEWTVMVIPGILQAPAPAPNGDQESRRDGKEKGEPMAAISLLLAVQTDHHRRGVACKVFQTLRTMQILKRGEEVTQRAHARIDRKRAEGEEGSRTDRMNE